MSERYSKFVVPGAILVTGLVAAYVALYSPGYLSSSYYLGGTDFPAGSSGGGLEIRAKIFSLPGGGFSVGGHVGSLQRRVDCGALGGPGRRRDGGLRTLHAQRRIPASPASTWWPCFAVLAALVSAAVSSFPMLSFLKALSLLLLFLYASTGARLALSGREEKFFQRLLWFVEIVVYISADCLPGFAACPSSATQILWAPSWAWSLCPCFSGEC